MPTIRIIATPPGEAPENVRQAWVGLSLPLLPGYSGPLRTGGFGVLSGPRGSQISRFSIWWARLLRRYEVLEGYAVDACVAIDILAQSHPEAATWWRQETPHLLDSKHSLLFPTGVCQME